jgi:hypothetical protein
MEFDRFGYYGWNWNIHIETEEDINGDEVYRALKNLNLPLEVAVFKTEKATREWRISDRVPGDTNPSALSHQDFAEEVRGIFPKATFAATQRDRAWFAEDGDTKISYKPDEGTWLVETPRTTGVGATLAEANTIATH